jgi:hypothetical protein
MLSHFVFWQEETRAALAGARTGYVPAADVDKQVAQAVGSLARDAEEEKRLLHEQLDSMRVRAEAAKLNAAQRSKRFDELVEQMKGSLATKEQEVAHANAELQALEEELKLMLLSTFGAFFLASSLLGYCFFVYSLSVFTL